jgi:hypothetical protein
LQGLRAQLATATVRTRELTGVGFFTYLDVPRDAVDPVEGSGDLGDVFAGVDGLKHGAGFAVFVRDGYLEELEGFSFEEPWPEKIGGFRLTYTGEVRDRGPFA